MKHGFRCSLLLLLAAGSQVLAADETKNLPPRDQPAPPQSGPACRVSPVNLKSPNDYYPATERGAGHAGRVIVEFAVMKSRGKPVDLRVAESSSYPELDAAALRVIAASSFKTTCPGERFKIAVKFG
jgi:TonB family protein